MPLWPGSVHDFTLNVELKDFGFWSLGRAIGFVRCCWLLSRSLFASTLEPNSQLPDSDQKGRLPNATPYSSKTADILTSKSLFGTRVGNVTVLDQALQSPVLVTWQFWIKPFRAPCWVMWQFRIKPFGNMTILDQGENKKCLGEKKRCLLEKRESF